MTTASDRARRERHVEAAKRAYRERFGVEAPVMLSDLDNPRFADLLMEAVEAGEPLTTEAVTVGLGRARQWPWSRQGPSSNPRRRRP